MKLELGETEFREVAESVLARAIEKGGVVDAIREAAEAALAARGLLDKEQARRYLQIEERTLEIWMRPAGVKGGRGVPHMKIGEAVRFRLESLEAWALQHEINKVVPIAA